MSDPAGTAIDAEQVSDGRGFFEPRPQSHATIGSMLALFVLSGVFIQLLPVAAPAIIAGWRLHFTALAVPMAAVLVGSGLGSVVGGMVADIRGRRALIAVSLVAMATFEILASLATQPLHLLPPMLLAGFSMGAYYAAGLALVTELVPPKRRALVIGFTVASLPVGLGLCSSTAAWIVPEFGWRSQFRLAAVAAIPVLLAFLWFVPESPGFLASRRDRQAEYFRVVRSLGLKREPAQFVRQDSRQQKLGNGVMRNFGLLIRDRPRQTLGIAGLFFVDYMFGNAILSWVPVALAEAGYAMAFASGSITAWTTASIVGTPLAGWLIGRVGLLRTAVGSSALAGAVVIALALLTQNSEGNVILLAVLALGGFSAAGTVVSLLTLVAETYPPLQRASGMGLSDAVGRVGGVLAAFFGAHVLSAGGPVMLFGVLAALMAMVSLYILFLHPFPVAGANGTS